MRVERWPIFRGMVYHPRKHPRLSPADVGLSPEFVHEVETRTADGVTLRGWLWLPRRHWTPAGSVCNNHAGNGPKVVYFPGRGGHRGFRVLEVGILTALGAEVLLFDYRGYADNLGRPTEEGLAHDSQAAWEFAQHALGWSREETVLYGESLGGALAVQLAAGESRRGHPPAGIILRSTFTSFTEAACHLWPSLRWILPTDWYPSCERIGQVTCPILILHGELDRLVPFTMGRKLLESAPAMSASGIERRLVPLRNSEHNHAAVSDGPTMRQAIRQFLRDLQLDQPG
ncbi:MAG: alpha/beta hydrolase [Planctomycetota bacterium]|nr:alpha/beta hydrolase [Planctomycetota bacterium]